MKPAKKNITAISVIVFLCISRLAFAAQSNAATLTGQVSNAATGSYLEGAVVIMAGTDRSAITDREGRYQFLNVQPADITLVVSFSGLDPQRVTLKVSGGERLVRDVKLSSDIYAMEKFTVAGLREGTAKAESLQRYAPNVKEVVSSDTFGNVADGNIGELLTHVAGISGTYNGPDVYQIAIRGIGSDLNSVTMDGKPVASTPFTGVGRAFEFDQASLSNIETIEVTKAPTPDMEGSAVGGSVNLVTKSAFDNAAGRSFRYTLGFTNQRGDFGPAAKWKQPVEGYGPSANFEYTDVLSVFGKEKNLGLTVTGLYNSQPTGGTLILKSFEQKPDPGPVFNWATNRYAVKGATRTRAATSVKLDYKLSDRTTISVNTSYTFYHENNDSRIHTLQTVGVPTAAVPQVLASVDSSGNRISGGYINPNYSNGITRIYPHPTLSFSNLTTGTNDIAARTYLITPTVRHRFDNWDIRYSLSYSNSAFFVDNSKKNGKTGGHPKGDVQLRLGDIGWIVDQSKDPIWPTITQTEGPNMYDLNNYSGLRLTQFDRRTYDTVIGAKFDLRKDLSLAMPVYIKTGLSHELKKRKYWQGNKRYDYAGADGVRGTADDNLGLGQFLDTVTPATTDEVKYYQNRGGVPAWPHADGVARHAELYPDLWKEDIAFGVQSRLTSLKLMDETISAAYVMGNIRFGKLALLGGVRIEETRDDGEGTLNYVSPAETARRAAWVGVVTDAEARRRIEAQFGGRDTNSGRYRVVLPGIHLKYEPVTGLVSRLSWSTGIGRPGFGTIIPNTSVNDNSRTVTVSNPSLKPQDATNLDLRLEYYFKRQGMVSVGAFRKELTNYIFTDTSQTVGGGQDNGFDGLYEGYRLTTQRNGGVAEIEGLEFSYQQQLSFLPGWWRGFGVNTNYTALKTEGNYGGTVTLTTNSLANFVNKTGNVGLSFRGYGFELRLLAVYRGKYLRSNSTNPALVLWQKEKIQWAWKSRYALTKHASVFLDLDNIFEEPLDNQFAAHENRVTFYRTFPMKIVGGVTGRF